MKEKHNVPYPYDGILFSLKRKAILIPATTWINPEDIMLSEISQHKKTNTAGFYFYEVPRGVKFVGKKKGWGDSIESDLTRWSDHKLLTGSWLVFPSG